MDFATLSAAIDLSTVATGLGAIVITGLGITVGFVIHRLLKKATNRVG